MAKYDAQCKNCDTQFEFTARMEFYNDPPECPLCAGPTRRIILAAPQGFVKGKFDAYVSPVDLSIISTEKDLQEHNKRNGVVQIQEGYSEAQVLKGDFGRPKEENNVKEVASDVQEAIHDVTHGYKPIIGAQDEE
jgi:putative FmdB family regulatory protein